MTNAHKPLLHPLNLAGLVTITAVGLTLPRNAGSSSALAFALLAVFALLMLLNQGDTHSSTHRTGARDNLRIVAMALVALLLFSMFPRGGAIPIVTVVLAAVMAGTWPPLRAALAPPGQARPAYGRTPHVFFWQVACLPAVWRAFGSQP